METGEPVSIRGDFFGAMAGAVQADFAARYPVPPDPEIPAPAGTLTLARFERWLEELWALGRWPSAREADDYAARAVVPTDPFCGAALFAPDDRVRQAVKWELIERGIAVHPAEAAYLNSPVQGPAPPQCELEEHEAGTWHREGRTWWK